MWSFGSDIRTEAPDPRQPCFCAKGGLRAALFPGKPEPPRSPLFAGTLVVAHLPPFCLAVVSSARLIRERSMAEAADDLSTPLGQKRLRRKRRFRLPFTVTQALAVLLG